MEAVEATQPERRGEITLVVVYGVNKPLHDVTETETIDGVKIGAMGLFDIPPSDAGEYVLKAKIDGTEEQLDEARTVESYGLRDGQKVTLAAGTPFGTS